MQCVEQGPDWASCRPSCTPGPDPTHWDGGNWSCRALGPKTEGDAPQCSWHGEDCRESRCCATPGQQCYLKQDGWATCKYDCTVGVDLYDSNPDPWECETIGDPADLAAPWVSEQCSQEGTSCLKTHCCATPGHSCFAKDDFYAQCSEKCDPDSVFQEGWTCKVLGTKTPEAPPSNLNEYDGMQVADWVADLCAKDDEDCEDVSCCASAGMQCYRKNDTMAKCKASCHPGVDLFDEDSYPWDCQELGPRTPGAIPEVFGAPVSDWVKEKCAKGADGCLDTGCCAEEGMQCYAKNEGWATCLDYCEPGKNRSAFGDIDSHPWACEEVGMRTPKAWGKPSLYCVSVVRTEGYEVDLMKFQLERKGGIFACDEFDVFSNTPYTGRGNTFWHPKDEVEDNSPLVSMFLGMGPNGRVDTIPFRPTYVGKSMDDTAGNTELFLRFWDKVFEQGRLWHTDWTLKVDPDAVLIPDRMRPILEPVSDRNNYIVNCDKPGMAPMMFGSVEMLSRQAMQTFHDRQQECLGGLDWKIWGEDYFLGKCFDMLGVQRENLFSAVQDGVCKGVNCGDPVAGAFHPMKEHSQWENCWNQATR